MAGTRLAAHACFLIFSLISVLVAWRLGVVKRAWLPLEKMASLHNSASYEYDNPKIDDQQGQLLALPVDIDVVILRSLEDKGCPSCAAALDAMQDNPSLARNAFLEAGDASDGGIEFPTTANPPPAGDGVNTEEHPTTRESTPLFNIQEVNIHVVHADHSLSAAQSAPSASSEPAALDDWLHRYFILDTAAVAATSDAVAEDIGNRHRIPNAKHSSSPRYTFFIGCAGAGEAGDLPTFMMGKRRHGYLGLGCACACGDTDSANGAAAAGRVTAGAAKVPSPAARRPLASAAALAILQTLAGITVDHVLRSPVLGGDVHVRLGQAYRLNFSLLSEDPALRRCAWDFAAASRRYLRPMLRKLHPVASFAVQSQEVQYARLAPAPPRWASSKERWYYSPLDLQGFLGANDFSTLDLAAGWGSGTDETGGRTGHNSTSAVYPPQSQVPVNFMVFCPSPNKSPLVFMEDWVGAGGQHRPHAVAYEVPGFGGVSVVNNDVSEADDGSNEPPPTEESVVDVLGANRLRTALGAHASQLRRIIGLPRPSDKPSEVPSPWLFQQKTGGAQAENRGMDGSGSSGICGSCPISSEGDYRQMSILFLPSPTDGVTDWEVDALLRAGLVRNRAAAAETLRSLAALVESQPEMEVSDKVAEDVAAALAAIVKTDAAISKAENLAEHSRLSPVWEPGVKENMASSMAGRRPVPQEISDGASGKSDLGLLGKSTAHSWTYTEAMHWAREALRRSESAYFDPTMVPQLYFPEDHLFAVYLPFLGPLAFPLVWGFAQELWRYRKKKKAKRKKAEEAAEQEVCGGTGSTSRKDDPVR